MYPPSAYAYPIGSFQSPVVPPTVPATQGPFLYIPLNCEWFPYVAGALQQLLLQTTWDTTPENLVIVQGWVFDLLSRISCPTALTAKDICGLMGSGGDDCMGCCLRYQNGKLQQLECGVWTDVTGQDGGVPGAPPQPGQGSPQPGAGQCVEYTGLLQGNGAYLIPTPVSDGDSVQLETAIGATNDSLAWFCPDGSQFAGGECFDGLVTYVGTDPLPASPHLSLLLKVGAIYFPIGTAGTVVVAGAGTNQQAELVMNTSTPATVNGSIQFKISVCNNSVSAWTHTFDFTASPGPFSLRSHFSTTPPTVGEWMAGLGWINTLSVGVTDVGGVLIQAEIPGFAGTIETAVMTYNLSKGTFLPGFQNYLELDLSGVAQVDAQVNSDTDTDGTGKTLAIAPGGYSCDHVEMQVLSSYFTPGSGADGTCRITGATFTGTGTDPFH